MSRDEACEGRCHESRALVRPPILGKDPSYSGNITARVGHIRWSAVRVEFDLVEVFLSRAFQRITGHHLFDEARDDRHAGRIVTRPLRIGALSPVSHEAHCAYWPHGIVISFDAPGGDGGIMHGTAQCEM